MDIVLGVSMAPASIQMVVVEGENADGATVEEEDFDVTAADDSAIASASDQVIAAILGTREGAVDAGLELSSIGVTWTDQLEATALRDALTAHKIENVMLVSAFLAATALTQSVGGAMGYESTAVLFVDPETATLAIVETGDGSIAGVRKQTLNDSDEAATAEIINMVVGLEALGSPPGGVFVVGSDGVDVGVLKSHLEAATALDVSVPEEPGTALARGAALAAANAPLFASSTAALAYSLDPGTGAVDPHALPDHLSFPDMFANEAFGDDDLAYSLVADEDAEALTRVINTALFDDLDDSKPRRRPVLLLGSGLAVVAISAVVALEIAMAIGIRTTVALQLPSPVQNLIVPTQQAPAPPQVEAAPPHPKIDMPKPVAAPKPLNPPLAAAAAPLPEARPPAPEVPVPVVAAPPVVPILAPPQMPFLALRPPLLPPLQTPPQPVVTPPRVQVPPVHQTPPGLGGPGHVPGEGPGGPGGWPGHVPGEGPGGPGGGPIEGPAPVPAGPFGGGPFGGGPFGGGHGGGGGPIEAPAPVPSGPFGGGPFGGGPFGGGPFGGGHGGGGGPIEAPAPVPSGPFGGGGFGGGGPFGGGGGGPFGGGGFGGGHGGGGFGGGGGGFGGGHSGGGFGGGGGHSGGGGGHH